MTTNVTTDKRIASKDGQKLIDGLAIVFASAGSGLVKAIRPMLSFYAEEDAEKVLLAVNEAAMRKRPNWTPAPITDARVSAAKGLWKAAEWKSWPLFLDGLEQLNPTWDDMVMACNWFRSTGDKGLKLDKAAAVPPTVADTTAKLVAIRKAKADRTAEAKAKAKAEAALSDVDKVRRAPTATLDAAIDRIKWLSEMEGKSKANEFLLAALKSLAVYRPLIVDKEADAIAAKAHADAKVALAAKATAGK